MSKEHEVNDMITVHEHPNGDVDIYVYNLPRFTVRIKPDGFESSILYGESPEYSVMTYDIMEG